MPETVIEEARRQVEQIRDSVADYSFEIESTQRKLTVSIGVACWSADMTGTSDFLRAADQLLYLAKSKGRIRVC